MVRFADGDRAAFAPLFGLLWPIVLRYCSRSLPFGSDAEDAAQEALVKVFSRIADFDGTRDGLAWVRGIARYEVMTFRRKRQRNREHESADLSWAPNAEASVEDAAVEREMHAALERAIDDLSEKDRSVMQSALGAGPACAGPACGGAAAHGGRACGGRACVACGCQARGGQARDQPPLPADASARKRKQRAIERLHLAWRRIYGD